MHECCERRGEFLAGCVAAADGYKSMVAESDKDLILLVPRSIAEPVPDESDGSVTISYAEVVVEGRGLIGGLFSWSCEAPVAFSDFGCSRRRESRT